MNRPWFQMYSRDWLDNKELGRCSALARAVMVDLMCLAHEGTPYGYLADKCGALLDAFLASRCRTSVKRFQRAIGELQQFKRLGVTPEGTLYVPRMVRDEQIRLRRAAGGVKGGNPKLSRDGKVNLVVNLPSDSDSDSSSLSSSSGNSAPEQNTTRAHEEKPPDLEFEPPSDIWPEGRMVWTEEREERFLREIGWKTSPTDAQVEQVMEADGNMIAGSNADGEDPGRLRALRNRLQYFGLFWRDYWRKAGKKKAREIWLRVAITEDQQEMICKAADRQRPAMLARDECYRPHASTWLGNERWNDEPAIQVEQESLWMTA